ncbi:MAG: mevalonate kinase [Betaproteobacteria bacterium]|nr:mevalonate kinase [Betaproteobacteria bacterium]
MLLAEPGTEGLACGKAILIGEHAAVAGFPAVALPLRSQTLTVRFGERLAPEGTAAANAIDHWQQVWSLTMADTLVQLPLEERLRLTQSLDLGLRLLLNQEDNEHLLEKYEPQKIEILSQLPLGAGMGGSAALSAALLRALARTLGQARSSAEISLFANRLDGFFHGRASGLDAATVVADGIIRFVREQGSRSVRNGKGFWLLLIDTRERTPTRTMVQKVAHLRETQRESVESTFMLIGELSERVIASLERGDLLGLGESLNAAHMALQSLQVSTQKLDACVAELRKCGALGAKLTGGGGGGLALGIFASSPPIPFSTAWKEYPHYLTFVRADENP